MTSYNPVIIIGAGRSGTNMLRDVLTALPGFGTWPCDEINYIWRHGNRAFPSDEFRPEMARPEVVRYIRNAFLKLAKRQGLSHVVEKTCANSLRVKFVYQIFPEARFIHIVRDGRDVAASATQRWTAPLDVRYLLRKSAFVPPSDAIYYAGRYFYNRLARMLSSEKRLAAWGPRFEGMSKVVAEKKLPVACAIQWQRCVETAESQLAVVPADQVISLHYESFVRDPRMELERILQFLTYSCEEHIKSRAVGIVRVGNQKSRRRTLGEEIESVIARTVGQTLLKYGYEPR